MKDLKDIAHVIISVWC